MKSGKKRTTANVSYTGQTDCGEMTEYIDRTTFIPGGQNLILEVVTLGDKIVITFLQSVKGDKYEKTFRITLDEIELKYKMERPFKQDTLGIKLPKARK